MKQIRSPRSENSPLWGKKNCRLIASCFVITLFFILVALEPEPTQRLLIQNYWSCFLLYACLMLIHSPKLFLVFTKLLSGYQSHQLWARHHRLAEPRPSPPSAIIDPDDGDRAGLGNFGVWPIIYSLTAVQWIFSLREFQILHRPCIIVLETWSLFWSGLQTSPSFVPGFAT